MVFNYSINSLIWSFFLLLKLNNLLPLFLIFIMKASCYQLIAIYNEY